MPLSYSIDRVNAIVTITGDYAEGADWRVLLTNVARDPNYQRGFCFLRDLRSSAHPVTAEAVVGIIAVVREFWDQLGVPRAAIVTRPGIDIPAVVAQALAAEEHIPLQVFTSYDDAVSWLQGR
jgi:hypothetical protein